MAVADQVTELPPVPLVGVQVSQLDALLEDVQAQPAVAVKVNEPLPPTEATAVPVGDNA